MNRPEPGRYREHRMTKIFMIMRARIDQDCLCFSASRSRSSTQRIFPLIVLKFRDEFDFLRTFVRGGHREDMLLETACQGG